MRIVKRLFGVLFIGVINETKTANPTPVTVTTFAKYLPLILIGLPYF